MTNAELTELSGLSKPMCYFGSSGNDFYHWYYNITPGWQHLCRPDGAKHMSRQTIRQVCLYTTK